MQNKILKVNVVCYHLYFKIIILEYTHTHMLVYTLMGWARRNQPSVKLQRALSPTCLFSRSWTVCAKGPKNLASAHVIPLLVIHPEVLKKLSVHMCPKTYLYSRKVGNKYRVCWLCRLIILSSGQSTTEKRAAQKASPGDLQRLLNIQLSNDQCMYVRQLPRKGQQKILEGIISIVHTGARIMLAINNQKDKPHELGPSIEKSEEFCFSSMREEKQQPWTGPT